MSLQTNALSHEQPLKSIVHLLKFAFHLVLLLLSTKEQDIQYLRIIIVCLFWILRVLKRKIVSKDD